VATPTDLLRALTRAYTLADTADQDGEEFLGAITEMGWVQEEVGWLVVTVGDNGLRAGGADIPDPEDELSPLVGALSANRIREVRFQKVQSVGFWKDFLSELTEKDPDESVPASARFKRFQGDLGLSFQPTSAASNGVAGSVYQLFEQLVDSPSFARSAEQAGKAGHGQKDAPESLSLDLARDIVLFRGESGDIRNAARIRILEEAGALAKQRSDVVLADAVEYLGRDLQALSDPGPVLALARQLVSPGVASHLLARFASTRDEWERGDRLDLIVQLGEAMAPVVGDALADTKDRFQRRSLVEAMVALGTKALPTVEGMLEDQRWFVVRNGVLILGEIGKEDLAPLLTTPLGHDEARVRREAVLALGKLGGKNAGALLQDMLNDPEPSVRAMSCRALGALKVGQAVKPLMALVEEEDDLEVRIDSLQALGRIGDPGTVPLIEKSATGSFFSKPPREIRVAAYRALASIGTPHAMALVRKAARDTDRQVRAIAQALLKEG
jgi:HEAT repeat protein